MNIPAGTPLKTGLDVATVDFFSLLKDLGGRKFSGYLALAIAGERGIEEGTMFFDEGKPSAGVYEYYSFKKTFYGKEAFERILNASAAPHGAMDVFELSPDQVHLVLAFNEAAINVPAEGELAPRRIVFSPKYGEALAQAQAPQTRGELLKKYRLSAIAEDEKPPSSASSQLREVSFQQDFLEKLVKKEK